MVSTALIVLAGRYGGIVAIPAAIIMAREVGVSALREWMAQRGARDSVKVGMRMQGKIKAALTMVSITLMLLVPEELVWKVFRGQSISEFWVWEEQEASLRELSMMEWPGCWDLVCSCYLQVRL